MNSFSDMQRTFVDHIRHPELASRTDGDYQRRIKIYQDLFFNNVEGFVSTAFPVLKSLHSEAQWQQQIRLFFSQHSCRSPYFAEISKEFLEFYAADEANRLISYDFAAELAHYEWLELDVSLRFEDDACAEWQQATLPQQLVFAQTASLVSYAYPVHLIGTDYLPESPAEQRMFYLVYRDSDEQVQFMQVNPLTAMVMNTLENNDVMTYESLLQHVLEALPNMTQMQVEPGLQQILMDMLSRRVLVVPQSC